MEVLRGVGAKVWYIWRPLDLLVAFRGVFYVLEVKTEGEKLNNNQKQVFEEMISVGCIPGIVYNPEDALKAIGAIGGLKTDDK